MENCVSSRSLNTKSDRECFRVSKTKGEHLSLKRTLSPHSPGLTTGHTCQGRQRSNEWWTLRSVLPWRPTGLYQDINQAQTISPKDSRGLTAHKGITSLAAHSSLEWHYTPVVPITPEAGGELAFRSLGQLGQQS